MWTSRRTHTDSVGTLCETCCSACLRVLALVQRRVCTWGLGIQRRATRMVARARRSAASLSMPLHMLTKPGCSSGACASRNQASHHALDELLIMARTDRFELQRQRPAHGPTRTWAQGTVAIYGSLVEQTRSARVQS